MNAELRLRQATTADVAVVMRHRRGMFQDMGHRDPAALDAMHATSEPFFRRALESGAYRGWLLEAPDGRVVAGGGVIQLEYHSHPRDPRPRRPVVVNMYTEPEYRRRGLARRLMQAMIDWARSDGFVVLYLHASDVGRPLYESLGFEPTNEMRLAL
jgi:GNAT superfamily N-acetyltransferase